MVEDSGRQDGVTRLEGLPLFIGLSGRAGSGKDTAAHYLVQGYDYVHFAFANLLKEVVGLVFDFSPEQLYGEGRDLVDGRWGLTPRWCLQFFGSAFRDVQPDIWVQGLMRAVRDFWDAVGIRRVVVSDVRLLNEAAALKKHGGVIWRLHGRAGEPRGIAGHTSETELDGWEFDAALDNSGSLDELTAQIDRLLST